MHAFALLPLCTNLLQEVT